MLKFIPGTKHALRGLKYAFIREENIRIQLIVALIVMILSLLLNVTPLEFLLVVLACFIVITLEMINTCFENLADHLHPAYSKEIGILKDISAGFVLFGVFLSFLLALFVLLF